MGENDVYNMYGNSLFRVTVGKVSPMKIVLAI
jgi:hypothetical protein